MNNQTLSHFQIWEIRKRRSPEQDLSHVLLSSKNITDKKFFNLSYSEGIYDPFLFQHMEKAVDRIKLAIEKQEGILIAGDYDLDGISGTAVLLDFFRYIRFPVNFKLPHRVHDGYGLNAKTIINAHKAHIKVIITVDNGISCHQEVALAQSLGIDVIITDHHTIPEKIPAAFAILHPKIQEEAYPDKELTGSGVAYKLVCALTRRTLPDVEAESFCKWALDLATLGTIADMGPLLGENRNIVHFGLQVLAKQKRPGIKKLLEISGHNDGIFNADVVGFKIGPRLNAAGRMENADLSVQLLLSSNEQEANTLAMHIEKLNNDRKSEAERSFIIAESCLTDTTKSILIAQSRDFHPGVIGLAASKLVEKYQRPVLILEVREEVAIGSMRSIPSVDLMSVLNQLKPMFVKYGGHAQAAGFAINLSELPVFIATLESLFDEFLPLSPPTLTMDTDLYASDISLETCTSLEVFEPFGIGNHKPIFFMGDIIKQQQSPLGSTGKHWKLTLEDTKTSRIFQAVAFNRAEDQFNKKMNLAVRLGINVWNNQKTPQVIIEDCQ